MRRISNVLTLWLVIVSPVIVMGQVANGDSTYYYPFNAGLEGAFALTDSVRSQFVDLQVGKTDSINRSDVGVWYWFFSDGDYPEIEFEADSGFRSIRLYGPFPPDYQVAIDSMQLDSIPIDSIPAYFDEIIPDSVLQSLIVLPETADTGLFLLRISLRQLKGNFVGNPMSSLGLGQDWQVSNAPKPCIECLEGLIPLSGKYVCSAWVMDEDAPPGTTHYEAPIITVYVGYANLSSTTTTIPTYGHVIDGWQKMEGEFIIGANAVAFEIRLTCASESCLFDDIRFHPFDASMKTYVYDPNSLRLVAELDERNYATIYEYDEEGRLKRVKKETERGRMTIQETSSSNVKE